MALWNAMQWRVGMALAWLSFGCATEERGVALIPTQDECYGRDDGVLCDQGVALRCANSKVSARTDCAGASLTCVEGMGCHFCNPFSISCVEGAPQRCEPDGSAYIPIAACEPGLSCSPRGCRDLCADAARDRSYLGCDYWPVFTLNSQLRDDFYPAVAIGNGNLVPAHVTITKGEQHLEVDVAARSALTVDLVFDDALRKSAGSTLVRQGAYHLRSTVPVTVHQFNPLLFEVAAACPAPDAGVPPPAPNVPCFAYSYTNDASLLLPSSALAPAVDEGLEPRVTFLAASRPTFMAAAFDEVRALSGFVAVVATGEKPVNVRIRTSANTRPSIPANVPGAIERMAKGDLLERTLSPGDVLQLLSDQPTECSGQSSSIFCDPGPGYDLTGTEISADGPIEVLSGHDCANVPFQRVACDHLEESMTPVRTWGTSVVAAVPRGLDGTRYMLRLISGEDGNVIRFDPPVSEPLTLQKGEFTELTVTESVYVSGSGRLLAAQYLVGQGGTAAHGDPSLALVVPVDQFRAEYNFMSPATYSSNYVSIVALNGDVVALDGRLITTFEPVGQSKYQVATVKLEKSGAHELHGSSAFGLGIMLYGVAPYTSYMLPGGLDLAPLGTPGF